MFKSVFTKYLTTFTLIIFFSFTILILVISSMVTNYSINSKQLLMKNGADLTSSRLNDYIKSTDKKDIHIAINNYRTQIYNSLKPVAQLTEAYIYVIDMSGNLLITSHSTEGQEGFLKSDVVSNILNSTDVYSISDVGGALKGASLNCFNIIRKNDGTPNAIVMISSPEIGNRVLTGSMIKMIISVSLWIFLAALISVYFISERIVSPLKQIGVAAKKFAQGKFDQRVMVSGKDEVALLAESFNNMADSLARLEETRSTFLANISHDLRTPMTTISGFVDGILDGTIPPEKQSYYLGIISSEVHRLSRLVNTLLQLSRLDAGEAKLKMIDFNLSEKARQILISFEKKIDSKHIEIEFNNDKDIFVNADTDAIHQVIYNLTDNAIKFTSENGFITITIQIKQLDKRTKKALFTIRNTGSGIPEDEIPYLFERFYKSDRSRGLDKAGTGLGLYIAKTTLLNHKEDIKVSTEVGKYTEFSFTLPLSEKNQSEKIK